MRPEATAGASLPQLRGATLVVYLALAAALAMLAVGLTFFALLNPIESLAILSLRTVKAIVLTAVSAILVRRRRRDPVAALLALAFLSWAITSSMDFTAGSMPGLATLDRARFLFFVLALLLFPNRNLQSRWTRGVAVASIAVFLLGVAEATGLLPTHAFLPPAIACVVAALTGLICRFAATANQIERLQYKWVTLGLVLGIGLILAARAAAALSSNGSIFLGSAAIFEALFQVGIIVLALGFLVSLLRYRLFDAETAITRSAAYAGLTVAVVATFAASEAVIEMWGQRYFGMGIGNIPAAIAAAIAAVLLTPLHDRISVWAEERFQRDLVKLRAQVPQIADQLSTSASPGELGSAILDRICAALHATKAALAFDGVMIANKGPDQPSGESCLQVAGASVPTPPTWTALFFPLTCPFGSSLGWLALGPRPDGTLYGKDEIAALRTLLPYLSRSLSLNAALDALRHHVRDLRRQIDLSEKRQPTIRRNVS